MDCLVYKGNFISEYSIRFPVGSTVLLHQLMQINIGPVPHEGNDKAKLPSNVKVNRGIFHDLRAVLVVKIVFDITMTSNDITMMPNLNQNSSSWAPLGSLSSLWNLVQFHASAIRLCNLENEQSFDWRVKAFQCNQTRENIDVMTSPNTPCATLQNRFVL